LKATRPHRNAAEYYFTYIDKVPAGDIRRVLADQAGDTLTLLRGISDERSLHRYAPGKWSIREVVSHLNDAERVFSFRAFWFARGFDIPMPSYDQDAGMPFAIADERSWIITSTSLPRSGATMRCSTACLMRPGIARGVASDNPVSVRALAYICAVRGARLGIRRRAILEIVNRDVNRELKCCRPMGRRL
jgi:hypothetical protein